MTALFILALSLLLWPGYWNLGGLCFTAELALEKLPADYTRPLQCPGSLLLRGILSESFGKVDALLTASFWVFSEGLG